MEEAIAFEPPKEGADSAAPPTRRAKFVLGSRNTKLVRKVLLQNGLTLTKDDDDFSLFWATPQEVSSFVPKFSYQKVNHFPMSKRILGNKATMAHAIQSHPKYRSYPRFFPLTFVLPDERDELFEAMKSRPQQQFIAKPAEGSCGNGIRLVSYSDFYTIPRGAVVQEYISKPLCIDGFKFDLRIYVLVTSFAPLRAYIYKDGLARFATESYSSYSRDVFSHLTNATLNKRGRNWSDDFKWRLSELLAEVRVRFGRSPEFVMSKIMDTVQKTLAFVQPAMVPKMRDGPMDPHFELFGFDLLFDYDFNPWLLEVNTNPSMGFDCDVDLAVKAPLLAHALSIVGIYDWSGDELRTRVPTFNPEVDDVIDFDAEMVALENARNEKSGNNFIRVFPSAEGEHLMRLCAQPRLAVKRRMAAADEFDVQSIAPLLSHTQATQLLLRYLSAISRRLRSGSVTDKGVSRIHNFLVAQGLESQKVSRDLKNVLHNYMIKQRTNLARGRCETALPSTVQKQIDEANTQSLARLLSQCRIHNIRNLDILFS